MRSREKLWCKRCGKSTPHLIRQMQTVINYVCGLCDLSRWEVLPDGCLRQIFDQVRRSP